MFGFRKKICRVQGYQNIFLLTDSSLLVAVLYQPDTISIFTLNPSTCLESHHIILEKIKNGMTTL